MTIESKPDPDHEPTSPWWLSGTAIEPAHHRLMQHSLAIPWHASTAMQLSEPERAQLAETWLRRAAAEYFAVSRFSEFATELVAAMAPADVLSLCLRIGIDEVRHAELCARMAEIYSGVKHVPPFGRSLPEPSVRPERYHALANAMVCVSETHSAAVLSATRNLTTDPTAHAVLSVMLADEVMHSQIGWSYLRHAIDMGGPSVIAEAAAMVPAVLRGLIADIEQRPDIPVADAVRAHGVMSHAEERTVAWTCVTDVLVPGFAALGIPISASVAH
jgi:hypothetical protein